MPRYTVVYTDPGWALTSDGHVDRELATIEREVLGDDVELRFGPTADGKYRNSGPEFRSVLGGAHALVISRCCITEEVLAAAGDKLKVVCRQGVGFDNLAPDLLKRAGIVGFNIPDYCVDEVAAHTLALLLALERGLLKQHQTLSTGRFDPYAGGIPRRLHDHTAGIIGFGRIGRAVASRLKMFYSDVLACDPYVSSDLMSAHGIQKVELENLLLRTDVVLLHCPLNPETNQMMNAAAFAHMKPSALLINTARGGLVEPRALLEALDSNGIAGAGIDVFSPENPHDDEFCAQIVRHRNVIVSSHRAYLSRESEFTQRRRSAEGIKQVLESGRPPITGLLT
jgi:D-3-phosphoglycerate dehydrogenase / 2-oxoglutarate reductase